MTMTPFTDNGAVALAPGEPSVAEEERAVEEAFPEEAERERRREQARLDKEFPKPSEQDILTLKSALEGEWSEWRDGTRPSRSEDDTVLESDGIPGVMRVRTMRYHRDQMPPKYRAYMNSSYRFRSDLTNTEIDRTVALATRNPPKVIIPPGSRDPGAQEAADKESRWCQYLIEALERQAGEALLRQFADGLFEGGMAGFEVFVTDAYDRLDLDQSDDETDTDFLARTDQEMLAATIQRGLPVGLRVPDPIAILHDRDSHGVSRVLIVEEKPHRIVFEELKAKRGDDEEELPRPGTPGWAEHYGVGAESSRGNVLTVRYYDRRWYAYLVGGKFVDGPVEHKIPGIPIVIGWGNTTSSSRKSERIQGVAWGMVEQEQVINDIISTEADIYMTYGRPKPHVTSSTDTPPDGPKTYDFSQPNRAPVLQPGQQVRDAYGDFQSRIPPSLLPMLMQLRQQAGINPVSSGESPGSDPSGFAINSLQAASQMRYEIYMDNYAKAIGMMVDLIRRMVKYGPIEDRVFVPVEDEQGVVEYLGLGPQEISDMPSKVFIDPMNDVNRLAIRQSLIAGNQAGYVPKRVVQTQGYGADDHRAWDNEIAEDLADAQLLGAAIEEAKRRIAVQSDLPGDESPSGLVDQHGNPLRSEPQAGDEEEMERLGGIPFRPRGESAGRMGRSDGGAPMVSREQQAFRARARGGQAPPNQGQGVRVPQ